MSKATFTFGRFNPPTEVGHGKLVGAVQAHAEKSGGKHYIFPSHSQDAKKNPLSHKDKVGAMNRMFPNANVVSSGKVRTAIDAMKHLEKQGHKEVTMVVGSDRVDNFHSLLNKYRTKEFPGIKKVNVVSAGHRDPDAEGAEGMSASKLRELVAAGKKKEFVSHYSDPKLGAHIHDKVKAGMQMESTNPVGIFLLGGPGSGKDYLLKNIFSRFDLTEVQADQILNGAAAELFESSKNIVINGANDAEKIELVQNMLEGYTFDFVHVSVTNKVSRLRNEQREQPITESKRIDKYLKAEQLAKDVEAFIFNNSINLNESSEMERLFFGSQIEKLLERVVELGLHIEETPAPKSFSILREKKFPTVAKDKASGLPKKYVRGLSASTAKARAAHWKEKSKLSDSDPRAYEPAPGDATAKTKPSKHTLAVRKMMDEAEQQKVRRVARSGNVTAVMDARKDTGRVNEGASDSSIAAKAKKSGISVGTLRKVYNRGVAAWNSGHRPGTTPQQWGHARVNSYINKGKTYHTADKDLREDVEDLDALFEMQLVGTDEYRKHAIAMTPGQGEVENAYKSKKNAIPEETDCGCESDCGCDDSNQNESTGGRSERSVPKSFRDLRTEAKKEKEEDTQVTAVFDPKLGDSKKKASNIKTPPRNIDSTMQGLPVASRFNAYEEKKPEEKGFMPTPHQVPAPPGGHSIPKGYKRVKDHIAGWKLVKEEDSPELTLEEAVQYHLENNISITENVFRPASEMFFEMIKEAKRLYKEGKYTPKDEWEKDMLQTDIGEIAEFEGQAVVLDYPIEEGLEECWTGYTQKGMKKKGDKMVPNCVPMSEAEDPTGGKGIGKPFRSNGGGAVYVRVGDGVRKINFSQSGMTKKFNDPAATRSFVARHHCLSNKDKTSRSYWACRWPRFFSNSGKTWW
jgi:dephospho-CoA kinase